MTTEEKAKAYNKVREKIALRFGSNVAEEIFSEFEMNEDEKTRKALISFLKSPFVNENIIDEKVTPWIAWLEKQGEKPRYSIGDVLCDKSCTTLNKDTQPNFEIIDIRDGMYICDNGSFPISQQDEYELVAKKIEPKFQNGQWIVHHGTENIYQVVAVAVKDNQYLLKYGDTYTIQNCFDVDRCSRLWDITKDAKKGDVLQHNGCTFIFICIEKGVVRGFEEYLCNGTKTCNFGEPNKDNDYSPATKEQSDTLMKAIADAGYTFDFEKKELKNIEKKLTWSEEDERMIDNIIFELEENQENISGVGYKIDWLKQLKQRIGR